MRFLFGTFILATMLAGPQTFAKKDGEIVTIDPVCQRYLTSPRYGQSLVFGGRNAAWTLKPEVGSIEAVRRGTIADIARIRNNFLKSARAHHGCAANSSCLTFALQRTIALLEEVKERQPEGRLTANIDHVIEYFEYLERKAHMDSLASVTHYAKSILWDLTIANFFGGEQIILGKTVAQLFPAQFEAAGRNRNQRWDREIDVAIKKKDGSWRWIEAKDWGQDRTMEAHGKEDIRVQGEGQNDARRMLGDTKIELSLVLKFGIPANDLEHYRNSAYDNVFLIFPDGKPF